MSGLLAVTARRLAAPVAVVASTLLQTSMPSRAEGASDKSDPFANLPAEDERTACSICLVNRQGPCRDLWRRFERCLKSLKENDDEKKSDSNDKAPDAEHSSAACDRYMMPWLTCIQSYRNLYTLYFNYMNQLELIEPMEKEIREDEVFEWKDVDAEWTPYVEWIKAKGYSLWELHWRLKQTASPVAQRPKFEGEDPEMLEIKVKVPMEDGGLPIQVAYAKDQGGLVLGTEHFNTEKEENAKEGTLKFSFRPGNTSTVYFFALYKHAEGDEARFLCSLPQPLLVAALEDGGIEEGEF